MSEMADRSWHDVRDQVRAFLSSELAQGPEIRLFLEAPASIAFLAGTSLNLKSGAAVELVQIEVLPGNRTLTEATI